MQVNRATGHDRGWILERIANFSAEFGTRTSVDAAGDLEVEIDADALRPI
jgi:hypothetical protein